MQALYTAEAKASGSGRNGEVVSSDGILDEGLAVPQDMGGPGGQNTNPEQLFAAGYAACFENALRRVADNEGKDLSAAEITANVGIGPVPGGGFGLAVELVGSLPQFSGEEARSLMEQAHGLCPYSRATAGNIEVRLEVAE